MVTARGMAQDMALDLGLGKDTPMGGIEGIMSAIEKGKHKSWTDAQKAHAETIIQNHMKSEHGTVPTPSAHHALRRIRNAHKSAKPRLDPTKKKPPGGGSGSGPDNRNRDNIGRFA